MTAMDEGRAAVNGDVYVKETRAHLGRFRYEGTIDQHEAFSQKRAPALRVWLDPAIARSHVGVLLVLGLKDGRWLDFTVQSSGNSPFGPYAVQQMSGPYDAPSYTQDDER